MNNEVTYNRNRKIFLTIIIIAIFSFILFLVVQSVQNKGKTKLEIKKLPGDAKVSINNKKVNGSSAYLEKGDYTIKAEREGFKSETRQISIEPSKDNNPKVFITLTPNSIKGNEWVKKNEEKYQKFEKDAGIYYNKKSENKLTTYPIIKDLPLRSSLYSVEYYEKQDDFRVIIVSSDAMGRQVAIEKIKSLGYEPSDYIFEFRGVDNPFTTIRENG